MMETRNEHHQPIVPKICVLKASIHCEGCKKKVKKILTQVHGVQFVDVDTKQHKVTVTGDVEVDTLVKELAKKGKHAVIWPEKINTEKEAEKTNQSVMHKMDAEANPTSVFSSQVEEVKPSVKVQDPASSSTSVAEKSDNGREESGGGEVKVVNDPTPVKSSALVKKSELKEPPQAAETSGGGGGEGKKKKKKGQNRNLEPAIPASTGLGIHEAGPTLKTNYVPPRYHGYVHNYTPPQPPVVGVSYNMSCPTYSYTASYYSAPPPYSYACAYTGPETEPQTSDSFELFSDENPNGCTVT